MTHRGCVWNGLVLYSYLLICTIVVQADAASLQTSNDEVSRVGVILVGEMRFRRKNHFQALKRFCGNTDVYVATYDHFKWFADRLATPGLNVSLNATEVNEVTEEIQRFENYDRMWQWYQLDKVLHTYSSRLEKHEVIVRTRVDANWIFHHQAADLQAERNDTTYKERDFWFYSEAKHFMTTWKPFWNLTLSQFMKPGTNYRSFNWRHMIESPQKPVRSWKHLDIPNHVRRKTFSDTIVAMKSSMQQKKAHIESANEAKSRKHHEKYSEKFFSSEQLCMTRALQTGFAITPFHYSLKFGPKRLRRIKSWKKTFGDNASHKVMT